MRKIALVSDIHGNYPALMAVAEDMRKRGIDEAINLGDHVSGPLWPRETAEYLRGTNWLHMLGNHDRHLAVKSAEGLGLSDAYAYAALDGSLREWIAGLPRIHEDGRGIAAFHGSPTDDEEYLLETIVGGRTLLSGRDEIAEKLGGFRAELVVCGHSHSPRCASLGEGMTIVNPGSVGLPAYMDDGARPHRGETGSPHARYAILEWEAGGLKVEFAAIRYDWKAASEKAYAEGREDWGMALRSGCLS